MYVPTCTRTRGIQKSTDFVVFRFIFLLSLPPSALSLIVLPEFTISNMPRGPDISDETKAMIVGMYLAGAKQVKIAAHFGRAKSTISDIIKRFKVRGTSKAAKKAGRPPILTKLERVRICSWATRHQWESHRKVMARYQIGVSESTFA